MTSTTDCKGVPARQEGSLKTESSSGRIYWKLRQTLPPWIWPQDKSSSGRIYWKLRQTLPTSQDDDDDDDAETEDLAAAMNRLKGTPSWLMFSLMLSAALVLHAASEDDSDDDGAMGEGLVEEYIMARDEAEEELAEFYKSAGPGHEPDQHSAAMENLRETPKIREPHTLEDQPRTETEDLAAAMNRLKGTPPWLMFSLMLSAALALHAASEDDSDDDGAMGEGLVEEYIMARDEAEEELAEFYKSAGPGHEPDQHSAAMENLREIRERLQSSGLPSGELAALLDGDPGIVSRRIRKNIRRQSIQKRTIRADEKFRWTGGILPYVFTDAITAADRTGIFRAMLSFERFTCIRFLPWEKVDTITTNQKLGLDHESYLKFIIGTGCSSYVGNLRKKKGGQAISCCKDRQCVHELAHALGEAHEQQSPNPDRFRMIRTNFDAIKSDYISTYKSNSAESTESLGYDLSSIMHYNTGTFALPGQTTFIKLFPELPNSGNFYYTFREVSLMHKCQDKCIDFPLICENDGYLTLVDNKCGCVCIPGLDPASGCTHIFQKDPDGISFPDGNYALPAVNSGCPDDSFTIGTRTQINDGKNSKSTLFSLGGDVTETKVEQQFCVKESSSNETRWTSGNFCIYRRGGKCPKGFVAGFVQYSDHPSEDAHNAMSGEMPDGVFGDDTRFEYCCANTGFSNRHGLFLPSRKPFALIKRRNEDCQRVRGMHVEVNSIDIDNSEMSATQPATGGDHPVYRKNKKTKEFATAFCVYKPAMIECGDIVKVDNSNSEVTINSPQASELECFWLIKAPAGERLQLDFTDFQIKGKPGHCIDNLEVRYVRPGQPGINLCGNRWDKTIISINNTIHLRLSTYGDSTSRFTASIKLVTDSDLCYAASDRGMTYDGDVNFTRDFEPCLHWAEVSHCEMSPYITEGFTSILEDNKCRNPNQGTGFQP
ncbi:hypothetical protein EGW08_011868 [Elysia chlorotica]|uniref:Metalloendopeptidase n=1 Tax=Elysia chlorotica TaxID=188477 RepID=A0A3S0ZL97_ELYCH|nr:hypothetical protein EGW08_011868 [Elysia chlorotica]